MANWYDSLAKEEKNALQVMEIPVIMFKKLCKEIETEFIEIGFEFEEKVREINNIEL